MAGLGLQARLHSCRDEISLLSDLTVPGEIITQTKRSFMDLGRLAQQQPVERASHWTPAVTTSGSVTAPASWSAGIHN